MKAHVLRLLVVTVVMSIVGVRGAAAQEDFSRFTKAINQQIAIVDIDGSVREGVLTAATENDVTVRFHSGLKTFPRATVASAERTRDSWTDGAVKGALLAVMVSAMVVKDYSPGTNRAGMVASNVALWSGIGWFIDAAQTNRESIYRAPAAAATPKPSMAFSFRF